MEHISTILQEALDRHAERVEVESPVTAEQIRTQSDRIVELEIEDDLELVV